jgi:hypothetical protein
MKSKIFPNVIAIFTSLFIGYGFFAFYIGNNFQIQILTSFIATLFSVLTLVSAFGINYETTRIGTVISFVGMTFFTLGLIFLGLLMIFSEAAKWIILPMSLFSLLYVAIIYFVSRSGQ